jgi:hypothetical protein
MHNLIKTMSLQQFNSIGDISSEISALDLTKTRSKAEMNALALSLIPSFLILVMI